MADNHCVGKNRRFAVCIGITAIAMVGRSLDVSWDHATIRFRVWCVLNTSIVGVNMGKGKVLYLLSDYKNSIFDRIFGAKNHFVVYNSNMLGRKAVFSELVWNFCFSLGLWGRLSCIRR